ncbi:MAG: 4-hydroxy-3-methylbut-2-enyl diphosphate reductase [Chitinispirillaceae bacterium]|nr:4-hydroxy-3-methylbut-2-enyl diphosphate reductase [Chitinispirillaceae bacterium]
MKIITAKTAGFCMGVKRAVDIALEEASRSKRGIFTIGPLIHNNPTLEMLKQRGVEELKEDRLKDKKSTKLLIRAHGIPPELQKKYLEEGYEVIDGTCPKVKTVHKVIEKYRSQGYQIIITGDEGHAEVIGLLGYAKNDAILIQKEEDVDKLPFFNKICLVSQTTFDRLTFEKIAIKVKEKYKNAEDVVIKKTICSATELRQREIALLSEEADAIIVVGGKNSANTKRLAQIASEKGVLVQLVENEQEIEWDKIADCKVVGVTAGASTPNWMIKRVVDYLSFMDNTRKKNFPNLMRYIIDIGVNINVFVALGAFTMYFVSCFLQGLPFSLIGALISFLYFLSMYLWNGLAGIESIQHHGISRYRFYLSHKKKLIGVSAISIIIMLLLSFFKKREAGLLMLFASLAGFGYHMNLLPKSIMAFFKYKKLRDIPSSRDLLTALAWGTVITALPNLFHPLKEFNAVVVFSVFCWIFILAFLRSLIIDLRDIEGDRIMGRETLITIVGEKKARKAIQIFIAICFFMIILFPVATGIKTYRSLNTLKFFFQIPVLVYIFIFVRINYRIGRNRNTLFNILADGLFYLAGAGALVAYFLIK